LKTLLRNNEIDYLFLGNELGGRPRDPALYDSENRADYERIRQTRGFDQGIERLLAGLRIHRTAMLCSEEDPLVCHRGLMITPALTERGIAPAHLRGDGSVESPDQFESRLLAETKVGEGMLDGLFAKTLDANDRRQLLADAYRAQALSKAFRARDEELSE
jgi:hypothetical protein